jgi:hypothetical protein
MRPDDMIFFPFGCDVPLVIRSSGTKFVIIGSCMIHGLMNGEIMTKSEIEGILPIELEFI